MRWPWSTPTGRLADTRFGFAVVGLGHGATKFLEALRGSASVRVAALVSGDLPKARKLAGRFGVPSIHSYADFDRLTEDATVDAVYLCLPNALHRAFTERAARAGKHVLCEKPLAPTAMDCTAMIAACRDANRLLMTGYRLAFSSTYVHLAQHLTAGIFGEVTAVRSGFGFHAKPGWRLDPTIAGGGSLFDVGIYAVNTLQNLFPDGLALQGSQITRSPETGLEMETLWRGRILQSGAAIQCESSYLKEIPDYLEITTERARLRLAPAYAYSGPCMHVQWKTRAQTVELKSLFPESAEPSLFRLEAEHLALCAQTGTALRTPGEVGLSDVQMLEMILSAASS